jgi:hypothetical protein
MYIIVDIYDEQGYTMVKSMVKYVCLTIDLTIFGYIQKKEGRQSDEYKEK